jgi:hypothetical protein
MKSNPSVLQSGFFYLYVKRESKTIQIYTFSLGVVMPNENIIKLAEALSSIGFHIDKYKYS